MQLDDHNFINYRFHWRMLRRWQRMNQLVRLSDLQRLHRPNNQTQRTEVNNNGHSDQLVISGITNESMQDFEMNVFV